MKLNPPLRIAALLTGALLLPLSAAAVVPADATVSNTVTVKYDPSSASTPDGATRLYGSLRSAAEQACRYPDERIFRIDTGYATCTTSALDEAVQKVNIPAISALHAERVRR